jgi:7,8-dihydroneopterin aldolase/epimerase/oxygenase
MNDLDPNDPIRASASRGLRHVFLRNLILDAHIGIYSHEHRGTQRVRVNVDLAVSDEGATDPARAVGADSIHRVVDYERVANAVRALIAAGHVKLVETLAEQVAQVCLSDPRVLTARVRVEKLDILPEAESVGVEVERHRA